MRGKRKRLNGFINKSSSGCKAGIRMARRWKMNPAVSVSQSRQYRIRPVRAFTRCTGFGRPVCAVPLSGTGVKSARRSATGVCKKGRDTIRRIIKRYAPSSENKTEAYIASVAKRLGVGADTPPDMRDSRVIAGLMNAIIRIENGKNPYSADRVSQIAQASTAGAPSAIALDERSQNPWDAVSPTFNRWVNTAKRASGGLTTLAETQNPWGTGLFDLHTAPFDFHRAAEAVAETKAAHPYRIE